jgi:nitrite reductase/ring-hydroxylating ferredoxin subunit
LIALDKLEPNSALAIDFHKDRNWWSVIVARGEGDEIYAYENTCPHARMPLERPDGRVVMQQNRYLICAAHGASFERATGACVGGPASGMSLTPTPILVENGLIKLV